MLGGRGEQPRRETLDAMAERLGRVEAGGIAGRDRVADGPVHGGLAARFLEAKSRMVTTRSPPTHMLK